MFESSQAVPGVSDIDVNRSSAATQVTCRTTPRIDSHRLMAGQRTLVIEHAGHEYHLRLTRNDKLILTK